MNTTVLLISADRASEVRHSLPAAVEQEGADVVVVDNASSDETGELAREHGARHLRLEPRLTWCEAYNAAIAATGGDAVLLLNADCFLAPGFLAAAHPRLEEPGVGSVAPKLVRAEGPLPEQRLDAIDAVGMVLDQRRKNTLAGHGRPALAYENPGEAFGPDGAAALYRRETLEDAAIDGEFLDPVFEKWTSDVDLAWRAQLLGWRCAYEPSALAYHVRSYSPSTRSRVPERDRRLQFRNRYLMMAKNDTPGALARDVHRVVAYELLAAGHTVLRERHLARAYLDAVRLLPGAWRSRSRLRRRLAGRRRAPVSFGLEPTP